MSAPSLVPRAPARLAALAAAGALVAGALVAIAGQEPAHAADSPYSWGNVEIVGGGFVPGIIFNQTEKNLIYARTDIGGAYRLGPDHQALDPAARLRRLGRLGLQRRAVSWPPTRWSPNRVYAAVGMYTNSWDPNNGAILRSSDRAPPGRPPSCRSSSAATCPAAAWASASRRPERQQRPLLRRRGGNGLWRSTDSGVTWAQGHELPQRRQLRAGPQRPQRLPQPQPGRRLGDLRPDHRHRGHRRPRRSTSAWPTRRTPSTARTDGGATWARIAGQPTGYLAHKGVLDAVGKQLYLATSDTGGPYDGGKGDVWKLDTATGAWTQISPVPSSSTDDYFGYSGLTIDRQNPDTIMVGHPDLLVAGHQRLPQHRRRRDLDPDLGLDRLPRPHAALHAWTSPRAAG